MIIRKEIRFWTRQNHFTNISIKNLHKSDKDGDVNESRHYSWRTELSEYTDEIQKAKTDTKAGEKITEKKVKNTIKINPPQGMTEAIEEMGGQILEMVEIEEADLEP